MSVTRRPDGKYDARIRVGGRNLKRTFRLRADAARWHDQTKVDRDRGGWTDTGDKTTVAGYFRHYMAARPELRPASRHAYANFLKNHLEPTPLGQMPIVKVTLGHVRTWAATQPEGQVARLRSVLGCAVAEEVIPRNPALRLKLPKRDKPRIVPLSIAQVQAWADAARPRVRAMILVQAMLGLRIGELKALRVADVNFLRREVTISAQRTQHEPRRLSPLKTVNSRRTVPLPALCAYVLAEHIRLYPPAADGTIFTSFRGLPWEASYLHRMYGQAAAGAGFPAGTSSHDLRHHCASVLLDRGESRERVAAWIGDTVQMIDRTYGHLMPKWEDRARSAMDAAWASPEAAEGEAGSG